MTARIVPWVGGFGMRTWRLPESRLEILWPGPSEGLYLGRPSEPGGPVARITHPTAASTYPSPRSAQAAVEAFLAAATPEGDPA